MFDIITFGSATWDISLKVSGKRVKDNADLILDKGICFNLGSKIDIDDMYFSFGGGGINTATTFKNQELKVAYCGSVGEDIPGKEIIEYLKEKGINDSLVVKVKKPTNNSVIFHIPNEDRTVLAYRGASELLNKKDINWNNLKSSWFYLAPLSGKLSSNTQDIVDYAKKQGIKTLVNFGNSQLKMSKSKIKDILKKTDVLLLNKEEAALLTGVNYENEDKIIKKINELHQGISIITKAEEGVIVLDKKYIYEARLKRFKVVDKTGAGDSFGSGFISGLIRSKGDIECAIKFGLVNSKHCLMFKGATNGLLKEKDNYLIAKEKIKIKVKGLAK
ncbi:MAG: carbohydrate kinase family protein [Candidatus Pacebacteria bacterium]|jgi:fructokinase|nr:carbohydrate kinase family protein [Candidatus Paceibacterota bacterium]